MGERKAEFVSFDLNNVKCKYLFNLTTTRDVKYGTKSNQSAFSLQEALDIFFKDESLNDFKCESCESIEEVIIRRSFHKLPKVLILYLKRYQFKEVVVAANQSEENKPTENAANDSSDEQVAPSGGKTFKLVKNDSNVRIPRYLTLRFLTEQDPIPEHEKQQPLVEIKSPLKSSENVSVNSLKKQATDTAGENSAKSRKQLFTPTIDLTNNSPAKSHKNHDSDDDLVELDLKKAKYDSDKFMLNTNKISEEDQLRLALELSMSENQKSTNLSSLLFLDGLFDDSTKCNNNKVEDHKRLTRRGLKEISINSSNLDRSTADAKTETTQTAVVEEDSTDDFEENTKKAIEESLLSYKSEMSKSYSYIRNESILNDIKDPFQADNTDHESTDQEENEKKISLHRNEHTQRIIEKNKQVKCTIEKFIKHFIKFIKNSSRLKGW